MMNFWVVGLVLSVLSMASVAQSQPSSGTAVDPIVLLQRVADSAISLNYSGVFVYRNGDIEETSRITRSRLDGREVERIEVIEGSAREIIRSGTEVKCFLPAQNRLVVEQRSAALGLPVLSPAVLDDLQQHYVVRTGGLGRVAGNICQRLILEPRDALRYAHHLWVEPTTGLLLKTGTVNQQGRVLESFTFTQVTFGSQVSRQQLVPSAELQSGNVHRIHSSEVRASDLKWGIENLPPGFRIQKMMVRRLTPPPSSHDVVHIVISDGLAAVSVFIEPEGDSKSNKVDQQSGAMSMYSRQIGEFRALVMGEVPLVTARLIADSIERRR